VSHTLPLKATYNFIIQTQDSPTASDQKSQSERDTKAQVSSTKKKVTQALSNNVILFSFSL
jgi:hypothetical protein